MWSLRKFYIPILLLQNERFKKKITVLSSFWNILKIRAKFGPKTTINSPALKDDI